MTSPPRLSLFAVTAPGLEPLAAAELRELGIVATEEPGGAAWEGTREELYAANLWLRTASRVLVRVGEFKARTFFELERHARKLPWERFLSSGQPVSLRVTSRKSKLYHEGAVAQRVVDAIRHQTGAVPEEAEGDEESEGSTSQLFVVRFLYDRCTVSADASGALLHLRGYRQAVGKAPLRETLAAAMLQASGWKDAPLLDPFCGSGTIPIEAALQARRIPPGLASAGRRPRAYAFEQWPDHDAERWEQMVERAAEGVRGTAGVPILGSDRDAGAIEAAEANAQRAGVAEDVSFSTRAVTAVEPPEGTGWILTNPPYGVRVGERKPLRNLYAAMGRWARTELPGWTMAMLSADRGLEDQMGIPLRELLQTRNGGIPVRLVAGVVAPGEK